MDISNIKNKKYRNNIRKAKKLAVIRNNLPNVNRKSKNRKRSKKNTGNKLNPQQATVQWLDAIVNPLNTDLPVKCPDGKEIQSLSMFDYVNTNNVSVNYEDTATADASGFLIILNYGKSNIDGYFPNPANHGYSLTLIAVGTDSYPIVDTNGDSAGTVDFNNSSSLITQSKLYRLLAGGLRILPRIEMNTSTSNQYVTNYFAGCVNPVDFAACINHEMTADTLMRQSPEYEKYINKEGVCVRYNPCQDQRQLYFYSNDSLLDSSVYVANNYYMPCIYVTFNQNVSAATNSYSFPVILDAKLWFETILYFPTPIAMSKTSRDVLVEIIIKSLNTSNLFPCVCEGHSFRSVYSKLQPFLLTIQRYLQFAINGNAMLSTILL
jgi:hypothetical protein